MGYWHGDNCNEPLSWDTQRVTLRRHFVQLLELVEGLLKPCLRIREIWRDTPVSVDACPPRVELWGAYVTFDRHRLLARTTAGAVQDLATAGDSLAQEIETPEKQF